jgi:excisionase family DNA binding protein
MRDLNALANPNEERLLDPTAVMYILGISQRTLYRLTSNGRLKSIKAGKFLRFQREELERFMREGGRQEEMEANEVAGDVLAGV